MDKSKVGVFGYKGMIGSQLIHAGCSALVADITDSVEIDKAIQKVKPKLIVNCAAKTDVDWCEVNEAKAFAVNVTGAGNVFAIADKYGIPVIHFTSDHVYSGKFLGNYGEDDDNVLARLHFQPRNYYGFTKFGSEGMAAAYDNVKLIRMSVVVSETRRGIDYYLSRLRKGEPVHPPIFLWRSFVHLNHLTKNLLEYIDRYAEMPYILNLAGSKQVSWWRLIHEYAKRDGLEHLVSPRWFDRNDPYDAKRPHRVGLNTKNSTALGFKQYDYRDCVYDPI